MAKINSLQIQNFKFFGESSPISIEAKHVLLYGENGSGKSSIYAALRELLNSPNKTSNEIKANFDKTNPKNLVNIYTTEGQSAFIKVALDNDTEYQISVNDAHIRSMHSNNQAKKNNLASDFIDYRFIFKTHLSAKDEIDLFPIFETEILPYIQFDADTPYYEYVGETLETKVTKNVYEIWKVVTSPPHKVLDIDGREIYPTTSTKYLNINGSRTKVEVPEYKNFINNFNTFNEAISKLISDVQVNANLILKNKLGYNLKFELNPILTNADITKYNILEPVKLRIPLRITEYYGISDAVTQPHIFLNEAKLTAIALAIRLAFLEKRLQTADLKLLVLDDLMVSLDMGNRDKVLNLIFSEYLANYQVFIMTHDRYFFHYVQKIIKNSGQRDKWEVLEMYVGEKENKEFPDIYHINNNESLKKAAYHLQKNDYPACGLYLRLQCEEIMNRLLPDKDGYLVKINDGGVYETKNETLNTQMLCLKSFCEKEGINFAPFQNLIIYKSVILNSLAHNDISSPLYKEELQKVMKVLEKLSEIEKSDLIKYNSQLSFQLAKTDSTIYSVRITLKDALKCIKEGKNPKRISQTCFVRIDGISDNGVTSKPNQEFSSIHDILAYYCNELSIPLPILEDTIKDRNGKTLRELMTS